MAIGVSLVLFDVKSYLAAANSIEDAAERARQRGHGREDAAERTRLKKAH